MKPALEKFLLIAATLAAIGIFIYVALWTSIKDKKTQMDNLFNSTSVPTSFNFTPNPSQIPKSSLAFAKQPGLIEGSPRDGGGPSETKWHGTVQSDDFLL